MLDSDRIGIAQIRSVAKAQGNQRDAAKLIHLLINGIDDWIIGLQDGSHQPLQADPAESPVADAAGHFIHGVGRIGIDARKAEKAVRIFLDEFADVGVVDEAVGPAVAPDDPGLVDAVGSIS